MTALPAAYPLFGGFIRRAKENGLGLGQSVVEMRAASGRIRGEDIDAVVAGLRARGAELVGDLPVR
jgi:hypothetical protein